MIEVAAKGDSALLSLLSRHPRVTLERFESAAHGEILFQTGSQNRRAASADRSCQQYGLIELMDNNPLVCAQEASCPGAGATLALIAIGPLLRAGVVSGRPQIQLTFSADLQECEGALENFEQGCEAEMTCTLEPAGRLIRARCICPVSGVRPDEIEAMFNESFGRSFFVRTSAEDPKVENSPFAAYALDTRTGGAARVEVCSDIDGKAGSAQIVHLFNVMAGFEESLGLDQTISE